VIPFSKKDS
jgi:hypothetical protein